MRYRVHLFALCLVAHKASTDCFHTFLLAAAAPSSYARSQPAGDLSWRMCNQGDAVGTIWILINFNKLSAKEETLRHEETSGKSTSGFILHTAHGGTDLGARASKGLACWLRSCVGRCCSPGLVPGSPSCECSFCLGDTRLHIFLGLSLFLRPSGVHVNTMLPLFSLSWG